MGTTIRWVGGMMIGALALPVLGANGCTSNPFLPSDVVYLQVYELEVGTGREVAVGDRLVIDYVMWAYDSEQADSKGREIGSRDGYTFFLGANQVNPAFDEGLARMRVGGLRRLVIPAGYVNAGGAAFTSAPPNAPVVAEVRMVDAQAVG